MGWDSGMGPLSIIICYTFYQNIVYNQLKYYFVIYMNEINLLGTK